MRWPWTRGPKPEETSRTLERADRLRAELRRIVAEARLVLAEQEQARDERAARDGQQAQRVQRVRKSPEKPNRGGAHG